MVHVITAADRHTFKRCRRAWDLGSRLRQNWEPDDEPEPDLGAAVRAALAVWYFPGMWEWDRAIVRPLALEAYHRLAAGWPSTSTDDELAAFGERLLDRYFGWAPSVDRFTPVRVETDFQVPIPDPAEPVRDLVAHDGTAVHFGGRIELLVVDDADAYWLVDHRVAPGWADPDELVLDEQGAAWCWAWERFFLGMEIAGVIYNELRIDADPDEGLGLDRDLHLVQDLGSSEATRGRATTVPTAGHRRMYARAGRPAVPGITREGNAVFRRTTVSRGLVELERIRLNLGLEARDMTGANVAVYPSPSWDVCSTCAFRPPCIALNTRTDAEAVLESSYRRRPPVEDAAGRLGGVTWSMGRGAAPPTFGRDPSPGR